MIPCKEKIITSRWIPHKPTICEITTCVYNKAYYKVNGDWICDDPRCNRGNSDASCYGLSPRKLLNLLTRI